MCGIAGFICNQSDATHALVSMVNAIHHRGPDATNIWIEDTIALGHTRLSVIDLAETGAQPMHSPSGRYVVSYNGEIYNHRELRAELASAGFIKGWSGTSDTETIICGIEKWGIENTIHKCIGMFAFAVWDRREKILTLARDRFGEKPLYYHPKNNGVIFASELAAIEQHPCFDRKISQHALAELLESQFIPAPLSIYQNVYKLIPGTIARFGTHGFISTSRYWSTIESACNNYEKWNGVKSKAISELEIKLGNSVQRQLLSDVPLGSFLSGGIDSSLITALMKKFSSKQVNTFSIGFRNKDYNEAEYAADVAEHLGTNHTTYYVDESDIENLVPNISSIYSEPLADPSQIPTYLVSCLARHDVTVSLTGDAGDEIFGGYNRHTYTYNTWPKINNTPLFIRKAALHSIRLFNESYLDWIFKGSNATSDWSRIGEKIRRSGHVLTATNVEELYNSSIKIMERDHIKKNSLDRHSIQKIYGPQIDLIIADNSLLEKSKLILDELRWMMLKDQISFLPDNILAKVDRASMGCSLESRAPYLDHTLVEFVQSLPSNYLVDKKRGKLPLREILGNYVPDKLIDRPKMGFFVPIHEMLKGVMREWAEGQLTTERLSETGIFDPVIVRNMWECHLKGKRNNFRELWPVLVFQSWNEKSREERITGTVNPTVL